MFLSERNRKTARSGGVGRVGIPESRPSNIGRVKMALLTWALIFAVIALVAGVFGFGGVASAAAGVARILFFIAIVVFLIFLIMALL
jgi:uncharacterized membrane protein YtjA (UPF0391 family)